MTKTILVALFLLPLLMAQPRRNQKSDRNYDQATEMTLQGTVAEVQENAQHQALGMGIHLSVKAKEATYDVHLGPGFFLTQQKWTFAKGDQIEITGSKVKLDGADVLIAREVKRDGKTLTLRDAAGTPKWAGAGRKGR